MMSVTSVAPTTPLSKFEDGALQKCLQVVHSFDWKRAKKGCRQGRYEYTKAIIEAENMYQLVGKQKKESNLVSLSLF